MTKNTDGSASAGEAFVRGVLAKVSESVLNSSLLNEVKPLNAQKRNEISRTVARQKVRSVEVANDAQRRMYYKKLASSRAAGRFGFITGVLCLVAGVVDAVWSVVPGVTSLWFVAGVLSVGVGVLGVSSRRGLLAAGEPVPLALPVVPPPLLDSGEPGQVEAASFYEAEATVVALLPAVKSLSVQGYVELSRATTYARPAVYGVIERLYTVNRAAGIPENVRQEAVESLLAQLNEGVESYRRLAVSAVKLSSVPSFDHDVAAELGAAAESLEAYAEGLLVVNNIQREV